jgi:hypothetical protein
LKPGGRFVAEMGHNNTAAIMVALSAVLGRRGFDAHRLSPWHFPSANAYRKKLEDAGFIVEDITIVPRPTTLPTGIEPWLDTFAEDAAPPDGRDGDLDRRLCPASLPRNPWRTNSARLDWCGPPPGDSSR